MPQSASRNEFIALLALLFATIALSIDAMLPALPQIAASLSPDAPNQAQLVITSFVFGMGVGTLFAGPLSDAFGRKATIIAGFVLYIAAAAACWAAPSLETLLIARVVQGIGSSAPRTVAVAMVRDLYKGRDMAQIMSFAMMIFTLVPFCGPAFGPGDHWLCRLAGNLSGLYRLCGPRDGLACPASARNPALGRPPPPVVQDAGLCGG